MHYIYSSSGDDGQAADGHRGSYHTYEGVDPNRPEEGTQTERSTGTDREFSNPLYKSMKAVGNVSVYHTLGAWLDAYTDHSLWRCLTTYSGYHYMLHSVSQS